MPAKSSSELAALYPPGVWAAEALGPGDPALLTARELQSVSHCAEKRHPGFRGRRACARQGLLALGDARQPRRRGPAVPGVAAHGASVLYTPWFWRAIMAFIGAIPERVFRRIRV